MANKTFNNIQVFMDFMREINGANKQPPEVLFSNLDPSGRTNLAIELAKIYSWAREVFDFEPYTLIPEQPSPWDPTQHYKIVNNEYVPGTTGDAWAENTWYDVNTTNPVMIDDSVLPDLGHTYTFDTGTTPGTFKYSEDGGAPQEVAIFKVPLLDESTNKILPIYLPSYVDDVIEGYFAYELLATEPASFDPTKYFKIVDGKYVKGSAGDAWAANTWYTPHFYEDSGHTIPITGESGKIYVDDDTNHSYRCVPGTPEVWVDISNPISANEIYELLGLNPSTGGVFDSTHKGFVPQTNGSTTLFLRSDGSWAEVTNITITPVTFNPQTKIADIELNGVDKDLYVPNYKGIQYTLVTSEPASFNPINYWKLVGGKYVRGEEGDVWAANTWYSPTTTGVQAGIVTAPSSASDNEKYLRADGTWGDPVADAAAVDILVLNCNHNPAYDPS